MALKLMYITNNTDVARIAEKAGVDRIFIDLETVGKQERQGGMDTIQSHHTFEDISKIRKILTKAELLVRSNPIYENTENEIETIVKNGADIIMLPYFKSADEAAKFLKCVNGRAKTCLLFETPEAAERIDEILTLDGIDEVFIGLNDLSLGYGKKFMFELLADGTVEKMCLKFKLNGIPYGFGGIAAIGTGTLPAQIIFKEHYRLGSSSVILSRSFCNCGKIKELDRIREIFETGISCMRSFEDEIKLHSDYFRENNSRLNQYVNKIVGALS